MRWMAYRKKRGPLNDGIRMDYGLAQVAMLITRAAGGKGDLKDFLLWGERPETSVDDIAQLLGAKKRG